MDVKIGVLCVTYNRLAMLQRLLDDYSRQEGLLEAVLVVDNASGDGTEEFLRGWVEQASVTQRLVHRSASNLGGAGGFRTGMERMAAMRPDLDFLYVADDDAFPDPELFALFARRADRLGTDVVAVCARVEHEGVVDLGHRKRIEVRGAKIHERAVPIEEYSKDSFEGFAYSFVGTFLRMSLLREGVLPEAGYFISYDDTEHAFRVAKQGRIVCLPELKVAHFPDPSPLHSVTWKRYYVQRNHLVFWKRHFPRGVFLFNLGFYLLRMVSNLHDSRAAGNVDAFQGFRVDMAAMKDALLGRDGLHPTYRPGWKPRA